MTVITDYITFSEPDNKNILRRLYEITYESLNQLEDTFKYGVPTILYKGKPLIGFAANKKFLSIYPYGSQILSDHQSVFKEFIGTKSSLHFTVEKPLPDELLKRLLLLKAAEIDAENKQT